MAKKNEIKFLTYKGKPLVRNGNTIYYGNMSDPYVIMLSITSTKEFQGTEVADRVVVQMLSTDPDCRPRERIIKKAEKKGLYNALDVGSIWLQRALDKGTKE